MEETFLPVPVNKNESTTDTKRLNYKIIWRRWVLTLHVSNSTPRPTFCSFGFLWEDSSVTCSTSSFYGNITDTTLLSFYDRPPPGLSLPLEGEFGNENKYNKGVVRKVNKFGGDRKCRVPVKVDGRLIHSFGGGEQTWDSRTKRLTVT